MILKLTMFRSKLPLPVDEDDDDTGAPQISLAEMLDDLDILHKSELARRVIFFYQVRY